MKSLGCSFGVAILTITTFGVQDSRASDFYAGKTVTISIGSAPGGSYDAYARLVSRHLGRHLPGNPTVVPRNMPGAAGTVAAAHVYNVAQADGTELGATLNTIPMTQIMHPERARYNVGSFNWIGTAASPANVLAVWHTAGVRSLDDAKRQEVVIGATTAGTTMEMYPLMANSLFGTRFRVVLGYNGGAAVNMAMEAGEVQGRGSNSWLAYSFQNPAWVQEGKIIPLFQMTLTRDPSLPNVPTLLEHARTEEERAVVSLLATTEMIGRSLMAPPNVPADRVRLLRQAYAEMIQSRELLQDAEQARLEIQPILGNDLQRMVEQISSAPASVIERFIAAVTP